MKKTALWILKCIIAGLISFTIMTVFCGFYSNPAVRIDNEKGFTDYKWKPNTFTSTMTEGVVFRKTDKNGFYNTSSVDFGMDVLTMGSSHMEGKNVFGNESIPYHLEKQSNLSVYNIGTSGHTFLHCAKNYESALKELKPQKYVIIETSSVTFSKEEINDCLNNEMAKIATNSGGFMYNMQKISYLRLAYTQIEDLYFKPKTESNTSSDVENYKVPVKEYGELLNYLSNLSNEYGVELIIFYHPKLDLDNSGYAVLRNDELNLQEFSIACYNNDITFVDMSIDFINLFNTSKKLPHGFSNTRVGAGHLNRYGNEVIATRLALEIANLSSNNGGN